MKLYSLLLALAVASITIFSGAALATPQVFVGRTLPGLKLGYLSLTGLSQDQLNGVLNKYEHQLTAGQVMLELRGQVTQSSLQDIGVGLDVINTIQAINNGSLRDILYGTSSISPLLTVDADQLNMSVDRLFPDLITAPQNATLTMSGPVPLTAVPSRRGERVDINDLHQQVTQQLANNSPDKIIKLSLIDQPAAVLDDELEPARQLANELLESGIYFIYNEENFHLKPFTIKRLLTFTEQTDPADNTNRILGVTLDPEGLADYLTATLAPLINQEAQNARFVRSDNAETNRRVTQFAVSKPGQTLNIARTAGHVAASLARHERTIPLAVDIAAPEVTSLEDIEQLGLTSLLATGQSDFAGSPKNRTHNITIGASRYHGLLISPGQNFSFNEFLGPVDGQHDFLPELVIKQNVTIPEFGGGLCQVSTTVFRAALQAGLDITSRRNHAYAVSYYGTPGLDATIYPPYTDLTFTNNTPSYILIQTKIEGTKLSFEFWGTDDGREVAISTPVVYDRQDNGAVKAYVGQKVVRNGEVLIDDTFYSRYKSPDLFPKVLAANGETTL